MSDSVGNEVQGSAAAPGSRRRKASVDDLFKKKRRTREIVVKTLDDDGGEAELVVLFRAIGSKEYDDLVSKYPPTREQKEQGSVYNPDLFAPALIAAVCIEPHLTFDEARDLYNSPEWSGGEISSLFIEAIKLCNAGVDVPFTASG